MNTRSSRSALLTRDAFREAVFARDGHRADPAGEVRERRIEGAYGMKPKN
jgi:hypothetical protein